MSLIQGVLLGAIAAILLALAVWIGIDTYTIHSLRAEIQTASDQKSSCDAANNFWKQTAASQNAAIEAMKTDAAQRDADAQAAIKQAQASSDQQSQAAQQIITEKVDSDDCVGARQVLTKYLTGRKK